jgi:radical SAM superfamily enzyme YgiQ (UPF0313 family)
VRVALVTVFSHRTCTLKDVAGGFGTVFEVGPSWPARLLERAKGAIAQLPPVTFGILAAQLREAGHRVQYAPLDRIPNRKPTPLPDVDAAIVFTSLTDADAERQVLAELTARGVMTIAIGATATSEPARYADVAHAVITGEPEALGASLLQSPRGVGHAGEVADLDALPFGDWSAFPIASFRYALLTPPIGRHGPTLPISSARGCPYGCGYCPWRVTAGFRERSPERVIEEVRHLKARYGVRGIAFRDPLFNLRRDRTLAIAEGLRPLDVRWSAEMRADRLDNALLRALYAAGLRSLELGVESADAGMLSRQKRQPPSLDHLRAIVREAEGMGIRVICNYVLGLPEDDEATIRATVALAEELGSFAVQFTTATPYPGTTLVEAAKGRELPAGRRVLTGFRPTWRHPTMAPERLEHLREWAYLRYHYRPRHVANVARHAARTLFD